MSFSTDRMEMFLNQWKSIFLIALIMVGSGYIAERYLLPTLSNLAKKTKWECDDIVVAALKGRLSKWSILFAFYFLSNYLYAWENISWFIQHSIIILFILSFTFMCSEIAMALINVYAKRSPKIFPSTSIFTNLTSSLLFIMAIILILQSIGISIAPLITALGVGGLAVALALQNTLSNFFAGLHILAARPIRPGDYIRVDGVEEGYVVDITWRNTSIRDLTQNMIIVPNSKMAEAKIINYNLPKQHVVILVPLTVNYDSNLDKVEKITLEVAGTVMREVNGGVYDYQPSVRFHSFGEYSVDFNVMLCAREFQAQYYIRHEFLKLLQKRFIIEDISLPEPTHIVHLSAKE